MATWLELTPQELQWPKQMGHLPLLSQAKREGVELEVEQSGLQLSTWEANITGLSSTYVHNTNLQ